jgi:hypothetical protein
LAALDRATTDMVDVVHALLDDQHDSFFGRAPTGAKFKDAASTAHLGCHVGILQRGGGKLDREGRDYWIKPLRELGAIECVFLNPLTTTFIAGHPIAKSANSAYRLADSFRDILRAPEHQWRQMLQNWVSEAEIRKRAEFQAKLAEEARKQVDTKHSDLINACVMHYAPSFLPGYQVVYVDDGDGDRITEEDQERLAKAGLELRLGDAMPDVLLWNPEKEWLWVVEAVTSDGEVDIHKKQQMEEVARRAGKAGVGFTTAYLSWKDAAARQYKYTNIAPATYIWIMSDGSKHLLVDSWPVN